MDKMQNTLSTGDMFPDLGIHHNLPHQHPRMEVQKQLQKGLLQSHISVPGNWSADPRRTDTQSVEIRVQRLLYKEHGHLHIFVQITLYNFSHTDRHTRYASHRRVFHHKKLPRPLQHLQSQPYFHEYLHPYDPSTVLPEALSHADGKNRYTPEVFLPHHFYFS